MERKINWLHFTDLHFGQKGQNILWPKIKKELFKDIEFIKSELGKIDVVFFSGDLTQSGKKEEFYELTALLKELWSHFKKLGSVPYLIAIPGNHDLTRPDSSKAVVKVLNNFQTDKDLKENFWAGIKEKNEYYDLIQECFKNFNEWYSNIDLPKPKLKSGIIPGDISADLKINDVSLRIVGLNTAFLELSSGDYKKKLNIGIEQVIALTSESPLEWIENADISILMTHHDPNWYDDQANEYYNNDINPPNTFYNHLCGHLHEATSNLYCLAGSEPRKTQLAPSLFGMQKINDKYDRIHGYFSGSYQIKNDQICERFYPRKAHKRYDGNYGIMADTGFDLQNKNFLEFNFFKKIEAADTDNEGTNHKPETSESILGNDTSTNILALRSNTDNGKELDKIPKISYPLLTQHLHIRLVEQRNFIHILQTNHFVWLITDWGLNEAGFIGSVSDKLQLNKIKSGFILNCEDIVNEKELLTAFENQFGMPLQSFCNITSGLNNSLLVLDHVNANLYSSINSYHRFIYIIKSINDFCPGMNIIVIARQSPKFLQADQFIKLSPLDGSEIKSYVKHHPSSVYELESAENLLKVVEITSGLPKHIDRIIDSLKVASFEEVLEAEKYESIDVVDVDQIPKSLKQSISSLIDTIDKTKLRSLKLLKILTVLSNGETIGNLKKFDGTKPIYIENANQLEQLSLVEVITTTKILSKVAGNATHQIKILRVPRQIRDYVNTMITDDERDDILKAGCELYFGTKWRSGTIKDMHSSLFASSKFLNVDNCHLITNSLMSIAVRNGNNLEIERAATLAINFCDYIFRHGDYRNAISTSEEIYNWLKPTEFNRLKATNAALYGQALRMSGNSEKSNQILMEALEIEGGNFSNSEKNTILIDLGFTYVKQEKFNKAIECAKTIEKTANPKGVDSIQARYILAQATLTGDKLIQKLRSLETEAKKNDAGTLINTISLTISELETNANERDKRLGKILNSMGDDYNKIRAVIKKSLNSLTKDDGTISEDDLVFLNISYSYLYTQRLEGLFRNCHKALWIYCLQKKRNDDLLNLFKHSSLIWRITGDTDLEKKYFMEIEEKISAQLENIEKDHANVANIEYYTRRKLEFDTQLQIGQS